MTPQETFVTHLRRERLRNRIPLEEIAADLRVKSELLEALENNDLSEWPRGLYARALIRMYATAVGLDPLETVDEFCRLFPHGDRRAHATIQEMAAIVSTTSEYRDEFPHPQGRRATDRPPDEESARASWWHSPLSTIWMKVSMAAAPHLRPRRTSGTNP